MLNPREDKALSVSTINRRLNTLRSYFSWSEREQYIKVNPMTDIKDLKVVDGEYEKIMWLTEKEFETLLERMRKYPVKTRGVNPEESIGEIGLLFISSLMRDYVWKNYRI